MNNAPEISIIMSVYNPVDKCQLFRAVESIIWQTFPSWELILYDDGSKKQYAKTIRQAARLDRRIVYIRSRRNHGLAHALNECIHRAAGSYIARMDDDDISKPCRLEKQYVFLQDHPEYQWVGSRAELIDQYGVWGIQKVPIKPQARDYLFNSPFIHPSVMFQKDVLLKIGGYSTATQYLHCEDYELFMRLHKHGYRGCNLREPLLAYWEDLGAHKKRTYPRRIREMKLRYKGFQDLGILSPSTFHFVLKPLAVGAIPAPVHHYIRRKLKKAKR